jgi:hypothetical protein
MNETDMTQKDVKIRQGTRNTTNVRVLITSLALVTLLFVALYFGFAATDQTETETPPPATQTQTPAAP